MRTLPRRIALRTILALVGALPVVAAADDVFYDVALPELKIASGRLPKGEDFTRAHRFHARGTSVLPRIFLNGPGEAYLKVANDDVWRLRSGDWPDWSKCHVMVRVPAAGDVAGQIVLPDGEADSMQRASFTMPASIAKESARESFYEAKMMHYQWLAQAPLAGTAWFRHEATEAERKLKEIDPKRQTSSAPLASWAPSSSADAYDLFSGGRAVSESLQLDRLIREPSQSVQPTVDIKTLEGITTAAIDWKPLLKGADPTLDPLSKFIPADQHAVFFPSFAAAIKLSDQARTNNALFSRLAEPRSEDADLVGRYERQLGIGLNAAGRLIGPAAIKSVALTGSDPYYATGTDVAVLFQTDHPDVLASMLQTQVLPSSAATAAGARLTQTLGETGGVKYWNIRTADRTVCSYIAQLGNTLVVVTNSQAQLERLTKVGHGVEPISSLDEFKFFRTRYPLGDKSETALLFLSDATIRRWCSARWRIASARRTFTAAVLADLTADNAKALATDTAKENALHTDLALIDAGELKLGNSGVSSSTQGSLTWMTPIIEMPIEKVTQAEADAYAAWRNGYQSNWQWAFDPIALRIGILDDRLSSDLTVMPLIGRSEYNEFITASRGAKIATDPGDRHGALVQVALALNVKSQPMMQWGNMAAAFAPQVRVEPFSWLGSSISLYLDDDPFWKEMSEVPPEKLDEFHRSAWSRVPLGLHAEVSNSLKLTVFLAAVRAFIEQTAPGMTAWESLDYGGQSYVRVKPTEQAQGDLRGLGGDANMALYYAPSSAGLTVTLNEAVLKRAIDRRIARKAGDKKSSSNTADYATKQAAKSAPPLPWLGDNLCLQVDRKMFDMLGSPSFSVLEGPDLLSDTAMQLRSWSNLPILNEWKRLFPKEDPVKVHERLWHITLICPGGGKYVWNDQWHTMESTVYGHPGQPKAGPKAAPLLDQFQSANFGLTFEEQGLRARLELVHEGKK
jgi:hypothetical protein